MSALLGRLFSRELVLDPRIRALGLIAVACWVFHFVRYVFVLQEYANMLWMCHVTALVLGLAMVASWASVIRAAAVWAIVGLPLWIVEVVARGSTSRISVLSHIVVPIVAIIALSQVRGGRIPVVVLHSTLFMLVVQHAARVLTIPEWNINLAHKPYDALAPALLSSYPVYWAVTTLLVAVACAVVALVARKAFPPDAEFVEAVGKPELLVVAPLAPAPEPEPMAEPGFRMAPKITPQEARALAEAERAARLGTPPARQQPSTTAPQPALQPVAPPMAPVSTTATLRGAGLSTTTALPPVQPAPAAAAPSSTEVSSSSASRPSPRPRGGGLVVDRVRGPAPAPVPEKAPRGFSMFEMIFVVALIGVMAAVAIPDLTPAVHTARMRSAGDEVITFLERARRAAQAEGRCHRVTMPNTTQLVMQRRTHANCFDAVDDAAWTTVASTTLTANFTYSALTAPDSTLPVLAVFRPNGRLRGDGDLDVTDDAVWIGINSPNLDRSMSIFVVATGRICAFLVDGNPVPALNMMQCGAPPSGGGAPSGPSQGGCA